jgi:hypothetical protein
MTRAATSLVARNPLLIYSETNDFDPSEISLSGEAGQFRIKRIWFQPENWSLIHHHSNEDNEKIKI